MPTAYYFTYTQVRVEPAVSNFAWRLSDEGRARVIGVINAPWMARIGRIATADEDRAVETAGILARRRKLPVTVNPGLRDVGRPGHEYLCASEFQETLAALFARPDRPTRLGWETARHAQERIVAAVSEEVAEGASGGDLLFTGHGAAGTLLLCHLDGSPISSDSFEPTPGGNLFAFDCDTLKVLFRWRSALPRLS